MVIQHRSTWRDAVVLAIGIAALLMFRFLKGWA